MADTTPEDLRLHGDRLVPPGALDFAVNVHGDGPAPHVLAAVTAALQHAHRYPDERPAVAAVAGRHGRDVTEVAVTAGAADAADAFQAFMDVVADPAASVAGRRDLPGLVVVRSVTKLWGLAGLRAGYVLGPPDLIARLDAARQPWSVGVDALGALVVCADDEAYRRRVAATVASWRADLVSALEAIPGVTVWDSAANFVLVRVRRGPEAHRRLLAAGIAVRPSTFPGLSRDHLRVAVRPPAVAGRLIAALTAILSPHERIGSTPA